VARTNLRELAARPDRFEHHLLVVARVGVVQLEVVSASEPLAFAHHNISDEYALALPCGDPVVDSFPLRTFLTDPESGQDVGRLRHRVGQLLLHPFGLLHWPGRLRPPYAPMDFPPGARRSGLSLVMCANRPTPPRERPLFVSPGLEAEAKPYRAEPVPFLLADLSREAERELARIGDVSMRLLVAPERLVAARGGYLVVLDGEGAHAPGDLLFVPPATPFDAAGIGRALWVGSEGSEAEPPPASWQALAPPPLLPFEEGPRKSLPITIDGLHVEAVDAARVRLRIGDHAAEIPRYWLARMLFRLALHDHRLGYVETYEGFFHDDRDGHHLGLRGGPSIALPRAALIEAVATLYRAVAPEGYREHLS
jgi:hypothetical protein